MSHFHTVLLILHNNDRFYLSSSEETYFQATSKVRKRNFGVLKPVSHTGTSKIFENSLCLFVASAYSLLEGLFLEVNFTNKLFCPFLSQKIFFDVSLLTFFLILENLFVN